MFLWYSILYGVVGLLGLVMVLWARNSRLLIAAAAVVVLGLGAMDVVVDLTAGLFVSDLLLAARGVLVSLAWLAVVGLLLVAMLRGARQRTPVARTHAPPPGDGQPDPQANPQQQPPPHWGPPQGQDQSHLQGHRPGHQQSPPHQAPSGPQPPSWKPQQ